MSICLLCNTLALIFNVVSALSRAAMFQFRSTRRRAAPPSCLGRNAFVYFHSRRARAAESSGWAGKSATSAGILRCPFVASFLHYFSASRLTEIIRARDEGSYKNRNRLRFEQLIESALSHDLAIFETQRRTARLLKRPCELIHSPAVRTTHVQHMIAHTLQRKKSERTYPQAQHPERCGLTG